MYRSHTLLTSMRRAAIFELARSASRPSMLIAAAVLLSACAQTGQTATLNAATKNPKKPAHGVMAPGAAALTETAPVTSNEPAAKAEPEAGADSQPAAAPPAMAPATIWQSADKLMGLAADQLQAALGAPARIRDEEAGRIYQYVGSDCVLDLFLYPGVEGSYRVSYAEARSIRADKKPVDVCLKSLPAPIVANNAPTS